MRDTDLTEKYRAVRARPRRFFIRRALLASLPVAALLALSAAAARGQTHPSSDWDRMQSIMPRSYVCYHSSEPFVIDGQLDEPAWTTADWTDEFVDIEGPAKPAPTHRTRVKMRWTENELLIGAELIEPHLWATLQEHDAVMFRDNDFEVFLDPDADRQDYGELELNAYNATWDLLLPRTYRDGGGADSKWEIDGLRTAVRLHGTLNDPSDTDQGWTIEIAIPWDGLAAIRGNHVPTDGSTWRINFSRVQWDLKVHEGGYVKVPGRREHNWVWSPQGIIDMHRPERWGWLHFSTQSPGSVSPPVDPAWGARELLLDAYYRQREFLRVNGYPARSLDALEFPIARALAQRVSMKVLEDSPTTDGIQALWITDEATIREFRISRTGRLSEVHVLSDESLQQDLTALMNQQVAAWNAGDLNGFLKFYWRSGDTTMHAGDAVLQGFWRIEERYRAQYASPEQMGQLALENLSIERTGNDTALVRGNWRITRADDRGAAGSFTLVWRRLEGQWKIVHDHTS